MKNIQKNTEKRIGSAGYILGKYHLEEKLGYGRMDTKARKRERAYVITVYFWQFGEREIRLPL